MKPVNQMTRWELLLELAKHVHPNLYHYQLKQTTKALRSLIHYYRIPEDERDAGLMQPNFRFAYSMKQD